MKLYANKVNGEFLRNVLPPSDADVGFVKAAIAYGSDSTTLVQHCVDRGYRLDIWMRYDHTVPVSPALLSHFLRRTAENIFCFLIPDVHHAKIIWWEGYGVYIGSANLTGRAWITNIEAGVFLSEEELERGRSLEAIEDFFDYISSLDEAFPLTEEVVAEQEELYKKRTAALVPVEKEAEAKRLKPIWLGPAGIPDQAARRSNKMRAFLREWEEGLTILRSLAAEVVNHRPVWLPPDVPAPWQADQFLHAYYYQRVVDGAAHPFELFHRRNENNPAAARAEALQWWGALAAPPYNEDVNLTEMAPAVRRQLQEDAIGDLTRDRFRQVISSTHSAIDHAAKIPLSDFGIHDRNHMPLGERCRVYADWLWEGRNARGESVAQLLRYVLYGGRWEDTPRRLYEAARDDERKITHFGLNQLGEIVGWTLPEHFSPRNGRTSKALRALGYPVAIY